MTRVVEIGGLVGGALRSGSATLAVRFRIFRAIQDRMHATGECPLASELALELHLDEAIVVSAMRALRQADGLPFPIPDGAFRRSLVDHEYTGTRNKGKVGAVRYREGDGIEDVYARFERLGFA